MRLGAGHAELPEPHSSQRHCPCPPLTGTAGLPEVRFGVLCVYPETPSASGRTWALSDTSAVCLGHGAPHTHGMTGAPKPQPLPASRGAVGGQRSGGEPERRRLRGRERGGTWRAGSPRSPRPAPRSAAASALRACAAPGLTRLRSARCRPAARPGHTDDFPFVSGISRLVSGSSAGLVSLV